MNHLHFFFKFGEQAFYYNDLWNKNMMVQIILHKAP
jgi:hypothetical protein